MNEILLIPGVKKQKGPKSILVQKSVLPEVNKATQV